MSDAASPGPEEQTSALMNALATLKGKVSAKRIGVAGLVKGLQARIIKLEQQLQIVQAKKGDCAEADALQVTIDNLLDQVQQLNLEHTGAIGQYTKQVTEFQNQATSNVEDITAIGIDIDLIGQ